MILSSESWCFDFLFVWLKFVNIWLQILVSKLERTHEWTQDYRLRSRMGFYAEGNKEAEEYSRRATWTSVHLWWLYDAIHVYFFSDMFRFCLSWWRIYFLWKLFILKFRCRTIYNMCTQKPPHDYSQPLYDKYKESFEEYIISTVSNAIALIWYMIACLNVFYFLFMCYAVITCLLLSYQVIIITNLLLCTSEYKYYHVKLLILGLLT